MTVTRQSPPPAARRLLGPSSAGVVGRRDRLAALALRVHGGRQPYRERERRVGGPEVLVAQVDGEPTWQPTRVGLIAEFGRLEEDVRGALDDGPPAGGRLDIAGAQTFDWWSS